MKRKGIFWLDENRVRHRVLKDSFPLRWNHPDCILIRGFVARRDQFTCQNCGVKPDIQPAEYDGKAELPVVHPSGRVGSLIPKRMVVINGCGSCHPNNFRLLCDRCMHNTAYKERRVRKNAIYL